MIPFPNGFLENMQQLLGEDALALLSALDEAPALAMRVNARRGEAALAAAQPYIQEPVPWAANSYYLQPGLRPGTDIAHFSGAYYLQEASAMAPAMVLNVQPGERVLDMCAAPGGKTGQLAAALQGRGVLVCNEPEPSRAKILAGNLERLGVAGAVVTNAYPPAIAQAWPEFFDAVLVDAPCSGEGMFRRDPDSRTQWNAASPEGCAKRQHEILLQAARTVRPGGRLVYSTCTFNMYENENSVRAFLQAVPDFSPVDFYLPGVGHSVNGMLRLMPHKLRGDGQFVACFVRSGNERKDFQPRPCKDIPGLQQLLQQLLKCPDMFQALQFTQLGQRIYAVPPQLPPATNLRVVSPGLCVCRVEKNRLEPEHSLAMALDPRDAVLVAELSEKQALQYIAGEAIPMDMPRGWALAAFRGMPLGWGKAVDGVLKNHLPKGLRK